MPNAFGAGIGSSAHAGRPKALGPKIQRISRSVTGPEDLAFNLSVARGQQRLGLLVARRATTTVAYRLPQSGRTIETCRRNVNPGSGARGRPFAAAAEPTPSL